MTRFNQPIYHIITPSSSSIEEAHSQIASSDNANKPFNQEAIAIKLTSPAHKIDTRKLLA